MELGRRYGRPVGDSQATRRASPSASLLGLACFHLYARLWRRSRHRLDFPWQSLDMGKGEFWSVRTWGHPRHLFAKTTIFLPRLCHNSSRRWMESLCFCFRYTFINFCNHQIYLISVFSRVCVSVDSGCLFTCGNGSFGQLGHGDILSLNSPAKVSSFLDKSVTMVACGMRHSLVLLAGNQVCGFGSGKRGQLGVSSDRTKSVNLPCAISGLENVEVVRIAANGDRSAAISANGELFTWGRGFCGGPDVQTPLCLPSSMSFKEVALGWNHALLLTVDGAVFKLGNTIDKEAEKQHLQIDSSEALLEKVPDFEGVQVLQIAAGAEHSVAVTESGEVKTWGWGEHGQLGLGNTNDQTNPRLVSVGSVDLQRKEIKVYCGSGFTYAVKQKQHFSSSTSS